MTKREEMGVSMYRRLLISDRKGHTDVKLYLTGAGPVAEIEGRYMTLLATDWDTLLNSDDLHATTSELAQQGTQRGALDASELLPPIRSQEVWAAGVTYYRSRDARMEEAKEAGGEDFYARVYEAERPELFFKAPPYRVVGPGRKVRIRRDSRWNVPEPELTLVINSRAEIVGYTIGNDMSSRDIEGENPLYLPQAKVYDGACALGPGILITPDPLPPDTRIRLTIQRDTRTVFTDTTDITRLKRTPQELVSYLYRETGFPHGCYLLTGTGIVPPNDFTLQSGDNIQIAIDGIGELVNVVE
jgi:2-dehydro-3-deoxy-D-arabinonate dehydratase